MHVVVETLNLEISRCCLLRRQRMLLRLMPHVYHDYIFLFLQSDRHCFRRCRCCCFRPCLNSLLSPRLRTADILTFFIRVV